MRATVSVTVVVQRQFCRVIGNVKIVLLARGVLKTIRHCLPTSGQGSNVTATGCVFLRTAVTTPHTSLHLKLFGVGLALAVVVMAPLTEPHVPNQPGRVFGFGTSGCGLGAESASAIVCCPLASTATKPDGSISNTGLLEAYEYVFWLIASGHSGSHARNRPSGGNRCRRFNRHTPLTLSV